jgi:hypothetical protein
VRSRTSPEGCGAGAGVDSVREQKNSKPRIREMLDAKRAARAKRSPQRPGHALLGAG